MNPLAILSMIQMAASAVEAGKGLIASFTHDSTGQPLPPETVIVPGLTVADVHAAAEKGIAAAATLRATSQGVLDRLDAETGVRPAS